MIMIRKPYTEKDFDWVKMTGKQMEQYAKDALILKKKNYATLKNSSTFFAAI